VLAPNPRTPVLTIQWRQKRRLAEKSKKQFAHNAASSRRQNLPPSTFTGQEVCV
jgi:hypothetical protein